MSYSLPQGSLTIVIGETEENPWIFDLVRASGLWTATCPTGEALIGLTEEDVVVAMLKIINGEGVDTVLTSNPLTP